MTVSISLSVGNVDKDDARGIFEDTVRALRTVGGAGVSGQMSYTEGSDRLIVDAYSVQTLDAADTEDEDGNDNEPPAGTEPNNV